jgi:hypothetical protein
MSVLSEVDCVGGIHVQGAGLGNVRCGQEIAISGEEVSSLVQETRDLTRSRRSDWDGALAERAMARVRSSRDSARSAGCRSLLFWYNIFITQNAQTFKSEKPSNGA